MAKKPRKKLSFEERIGKAKKKKGMDDAYFHTTILFRVTAHAEGIWIARRKEFLSMDDIRLRMAEQHPNITPHHHNAWGGVMRALVVDNVCVETNDTVKSCRAPRHHSEIKVWWSKIYQGIQRVKKPRKRKKLDPNQLDIFDLPGDESEPA